MQRLLSSFQCAWLAVVNIRNLHALPAGGPGGPQHGGFNKGMPGGFGPGPLGPRPPRAGGGPFPPMVHPMGMHMMGGPPMMMMGGGGGPMMGMGGPMMGG